MRFSKEFLGFGLFFIFFIMKVGLTPKLQQKKIWENKIPVYGFWDVRANGLNKINAQTN